MREHTYEVAKGNQVKPEHVGKKVSWMKAQTVAEALSAGHFENEEALVAAAEQQRDIAVREDIRDILSTDDGTLEAAAEAAKTLTVGKPRAGGGVSKVVKPKTQAERAAKGSGNRLFERAQADEKFLARMVKDQIIDMDEYNAWLSFKTNGNGSAATTEAATA
jgi:hypothetical protein